MQSKEFLKTRSNNLEITVHQKLNQASNIHIIFLHGWGSSSENWVKQNNDESLLKYNLYFIDRPGHGESGDIKDFNEDILNQEIQIMSDFIKNLNGKVCVIGHSFGTTIAKRIVEKTEYIGVYINPMLHEIKLSNKIQNLVKKIMVNKAFDKLFRNKITMSLWAKWLGDSKSKHDKESRKVTAKGMLQTKPKAFWSFLLWNKVSDFNDLNEREIAIFSANDPTINSKTDIKKSERVTILERGGHCSPRTMPKEINEIICNFVEMR